MRWTPRYAHTVATLIYSYTHTLIQSYTNIRIYEYTNIRIYEYTNTRIYEYTNTLIHSYTYTPIHPYTTYTTYIGGGKGGKRRLLCLHHALQFKRSLPIIEAIIAAYPSAIGIAEEEEGMYPLSFAMTRHMPLPVLQLLQSKHIRAAYAVDKEGALPIHYAIVHHAPVEMVD